MLCFIRDRLERQLAAVEASLLTLEKQMQREAEDKVELVTST